MKQSAPSALRNRGPILDVLRRVLPSTGLVLEIASGTGEHVTFFAQQLPMITFQPSDIDAAARASVDAWRTELALDNVKAPLSLDARDADATWPFNDESVDAIVNINMIHISPWSATLGLFRHAARVLKRGAPLVTYGPYLRKDIATAPSNIAFDESLRSRNPEWGVRQLEDVAAAAQQHGVVLAEVVEMPANNICAVFRRALIPNPK